jgi:hypothetical protein
VATIETESELVEVKLGQEEEEISESDRVRTENLLIDVLIIEQFKRFVRKESELQTHVVQWDG